LPLAPNSGSGPVEAKSSTGSTLLGLVGTGGVFAPGTSSGKKSKPISPAAKLCCSSLSCWAWAIPRVVPAGAPEVGRRSASAAPADRGVYCSSFIS
jgi:hypothetical protein